MPRTHLLIEKIYLKKKIKDNFKKKYEEYIFKMVRIRNQNFIFSLVLKK